MVAIVASDIDNISLLLGDIRGSLRALESKVDTNNTHAEHASTTLLTALREQDQRLDKLASDSRLMREQLDDVIAIAGDSKIVTDDVKRWRQLGLGVIGLVGIAAAWVGANGMWVVDAVVSWLKTRLGL